MSTWHTQEDYLALSCRAVHIACVSVCPAQMHTVCPQPKRYVLRNPYTNHHVNLQAHGNLSQTPTSLYFPVLHPRLADPRNSVQSLVTFRVANGCRQAHLSNFFVSCPYIWSGIAPDGEVVRIGILQASYTQNPHQMKGSKWSS